MEATYSFISKEIELSFKKEDNKRKTEILDKLAKKLDYRVQGGALLLGVNGNVVVCHGCSDSYAITQAIKLANDISSSCTVSNCQQNI